MSKKSFLIALGTTLGLIVLILSFWAIKGKIQDNQEKISQEPIELEAIKLVDKTCPNCFDEDYLLNVLKQENVVFKSIREVEAASTEGQELQVKYFVNKLPILFIEGETKKSQEFLDFWQGFGTVQDDVLISNVYPPYVDLKTKETVGLVDLTIIYDDTCTECYNTQKHLDFLKAEGIEPVNTKKLNINNEEAQQLIAKYQITKLPTIILSPAAKYYEIFTEHWKEVGKISEDGNYIFTAPEKIGTYKDLSTNKIEKVEIKQ